jgi:hypothetical protein
MRSERAVVITLSRQRVCKEHCLQADYCLSAVCVSQQTQNSWPDSRSSQATVAKQVAQMPGPSRLFADYKFKSGLRSANSWLQYQPLADCLPIMNYQLADLKYFKISTCTPYLRVLGSTIYYNICIYIKVNQH